MDVQSQIDYHQTLLDRCTSLIAACDSKASFALAFVGVIIGMTVSRIPENPINDGMILEYIRYAALILQMISCTFFLLTIMPKGKLKPKDNFILDRMKSISDEKTYLEKLKEQISDSAGIYSRKCSCYKWGTVLLVLSLVLIFLSEVIPYASICT